MLCIDVASIVAKQSWLNQTSALGTTTVYTPAAAGLFRVSAYVELRNTTDASVSSFLSWTDDYLTQSTKSLGNSAPTIAGGWSITGDSAIRAFRSGASAIQVSTTTAGATHYDLYVVIEQLW